MDRTCYQCAASRLSAGGKRRGFSPPDRGEVILLRVFLLEKAVYELGYELNNRPAWVEIPLRGIRDALAPATE